MTSTFTTNKKLEEPALNDPNWNTPLNANFEIIDNAFGSFVNIATKTGNYALLPADLQNMCWKSNSGTFTGNVTYTIPNGVKGQWVVLNQSDPSEFTLSIVCGSSSVSVERGKTRSIYCDGTVVFYADSPASAGSNTQVIYNSAGSLVGSNNLTFNGTSVLGVGGSTATTDASCAGTTATVTFSNGQTIPVGSVVTITGVTPTGYNGTWVTTGTATLNKVQFTVPSTLTSQTVAGLISYGNLNLGGSLIGGISSQELAVAGTNNNSVMTPLATAQAIAAKTTSSTAVNGWQKLPSGLILQWAKGVLDPSGETSQTITFPIAFPTACLNVQVTTNIPSATSSNDNWYQTAGTPSKTSVIVQRQSTNSNYNDTTPFIFAIGY